MQNVKSQKVFFFASNKAEITLTKTKERKNSRQLRVRKKEGEEKKQCQVALLVVLFWPGEVYLAVTFSKNTATHLTNINRTEFEVVKKADQIILLTWYIASSAGTIPLCLRMLFTRNIVNKSFKPHH